MVFIFYALAIAFMLILRPILIRHLLNGPILVSLPDVGRVSIHIALYFFPQLAGIHALFSGLICKYSTIAILSVILVRLLNCTLAIFSVCDACFHDSFADYSFPYIVIVASLMSSAAHFAVICDQVQKKYFPTPLEYIQTNSFRAYHRYFHLRYTNSSQSSFFFPPSKKFCCFYHALDWPYEIIYGVIYPFEKGMAGQLSWCTSKNVISTIRWSLYTVIF